MRFEGGDPLRLLGLSLEILGGLVEGQVLHVEETLIEVVYSLQYFLQIVHEVLER